MGEIRFFWNSLALRITLLALAIVVVGMWSLSLFTSRILRMDMQAQLGAQQFSTASYIATSIEREIEIRLDALQIIASSITPDLLRKPAELGKLIQERPVFQGLFNAGAHATGLDGEPIYALPENPRDVKRIATFLLQGERSHIFLSEGSPNAFRMVVPLVDSRGRIYGSLVGKSSLEEPDFLQTIARSRYGETGGYQLYSQQQSRVVMASATPANGSPSWLAPLGNNKEGTGIRADPSGLEWLVSSKGIAAANWTISVMLPTQEAFAPVRDQQSRLMLATWVLSLAAAAVTWWLLRRQLFPIRSTVRALSQRSNSDLPLQPLPLTQQVEVDLLIGGFNSLLLELSNRNDELKAGVTLNRDTLNSVEAHIAVLNAQGEIIAINQRWQDYLNRLSQDGAFGATGKHYQTLFTSLLQQNQITTQSLVEGVSAVLQGEKPSFTLEYPVHDPDNLHWFYLSVTPLGTDRHGAVISRTDISERKLAESLIRQLSRVAEQAPISIVITDLRGSMEYTNPYFSEVTGYSAQEVAGQNPRMLKSGLTPAVVYQSLWASLRARRTWRGELHNRKKNGDVFAVKAVISPVLNAQGQITHYVALTEDITESKQLEEHRLNLTSRLEELTRRLVRTQEETRLRFSQELHDRTSPNLSALRINFDILANSGQLASRSQDQSDRIDDTRALIDDTTLSIREICAGLHPAAIERAGLAGVIHSYAQQISKRTGMCVQVQCVHPYIRLPSDMELALFRVVQEALTNCVKHANAEQVDIMVQLDTKPIRLSITDNGCGFDPDTMARNTELQGLGLLNMRDTVEFSGGTFRLDSVLGRGTQIHLEIWGHSKETT